MDNLLCVGGVANGERADIDSNHDYVSCAMPMRFHLHEPEDIIDPRGCIHISNYCRRWFRGWVGGSRQQYEVLVDTSITEEESVGFFTELFKKGIRP